MWEGRKYLGNVHKKVGNLRQKDEESRDNNHNDEDEIELAGRYDDRRRLIAGNRRRKNRRLRFDGK